MCFCRNWNGVLLFSPKRSLATELILFNCLEQMSCRFIEGVADYVKKKRQHRCRQVDESSREAPPPHGKANMGGLMTVWGLVKSMEGKRCSLVCLMYCLTEHTSQWEKGCTWIEVTKGVNHFQTTRQPCRRQQVLLLETAGTSGGDSRYFCWRQRVLPAETAGTYWIRTRCLGRW